MRPPQRHRTLGVEIVFDVPLHETGHCKRQHERAGDAATISEGGRTARFQPVDHRYRMARPLQIAGAPHADHPGSDDNDILAHDPPNIPAGLLLGG